MKTTKVQEARSILAGLVTLGPALTAEALHERLLKIDALLFEGMRNETVVTCHLCHCEMHHWQTKSVHGFASKKVRQCIDSNACRVTRQLNAGLA